MTTTIGKEAIKLANEIFRDMAKTGCIATDSQKRTAICFLPRQRARFEKCKDCLYWRG